MDTTLPALPASPPKAREPSAKVKCALDLMVLEGVHRDKAAKAAGLQSKSLYHALRKVHVMRYYNELLGIVRTSARARNLHRLEHIRDRSKNDMASVAAVKTLEQIVENAPPAGAAPRQPGLVIVILPPLPATSRPAPSPTIDITPVEISPPASD
jgi:hypothetical protein